MLSLRNLLRGSKVGLPSGQAVAHQMGLKIIPDEELSIGRANAGGLLGGKDAGKMVCVTTLSDKFKGKASLWLYILAEARHQWVKAVESLPTDKDKNNMHTHLDGVGTYRC